MTAQPLRATFSAPPAADPRRARLRALAWRLDLASLFAALRAMGYGWDELRFAGHATTESPSRIIQDLEFLDDPRQVRITLNLGLLGPQSPLPSYFFKDVDAGTIDPASFSRFVGFFDHVVLSRFVLALHPELDRRLYPDPAHARRQELRLLNLRSTATLHWLFAQVFPELGARVEPIRKQRRLRVGALRLGSAVLGGDGTIGGRASVAGPGRRVTLFAEDERAGSGKPWPIEVRARLEADVLPLIRPAAVELEVFLTLRDQTAWARLQRGSHLGYDQLRGGKADRRIKLFDSEEDVP